MKRRPIKRRQFRVFVWSENSETKYITIARTIDEARNQILAAPEWIPESLLAKEPEIHSLYERPVIVAGY